MEEYAITFWALLNEGYRQEHENLLMLTNITMLPNADKDSRDEFIRKLQWASTDPGDILKPSDDYSGLADVKKILGR